MTILANAQEHFKSKLSGGLQKITVPEWKTDIYFKTAYPFSVEQKIIALQQEGKTVEALVETIILKALDPDGKPLFNKFDKAALMNDVDPNVIISVCGQINNPVDSVEVIEKN
ncbi:tail assembly chaperone [Phage DSL-LC06]|nr:tail assembly chaperone [Phage DSL-LC06]